MFTSVCLSSELKILHASEGLGVERNFSEFVLRSLLLLIERNKRAQLVTRNIAGAAADARTSVAETANITAGGKASIGKFVIGTVGSGDGAG